MSIIEIEPNPEVVDGPAGPVAGLADGPSIDLTDQARASRVRPTFTITDAAVACAVSRKTITRKLADLAEHGAAKDDDGIWRIPVEALLAVGLHPGRSLPEQQSARRPTVAAPAAASPALAPVERGAEADLVTVPRQRWDDLRIRLARAEAEASERALALADARLALRALTAGPAQSPVGAAPGGHATDGTSGPGALPVDPSSSPSVAVAQPAATPAGAATGVGPLTGPAPSAATVQPGAGEVAAQLAAARTHAAQNGGYVPAAPVAPVRKRRWWQSK